jgi:hypothetical protein
MALIVRPSIGRTENPSASHASRAASSIAGQP